MPRRQPAQPPKAQEPTPEPREPGAKAVSTVTHPEKEVNPWSDLETSTVPGCRPWGCKSDDNPWADLPTKWEEEPVTYYHTKEMYFKEYQPSAEADAVYAQARALWEASQVPPPEVNWQDPWAKERPPRQDPQAKISGLVTEKHLKKEWL